MLSGRRILVFMGFIYAKKRKKSNKNFVYKWLKSILQYILFSSSPLIPNESIFFVSASLSLCLVPRSTFDLICLPLLIYDVIPYETRKESKYWLGLYSSTTLLKSYRFSIANSNYYRLPIHLTVYKNSKYLWVGK